MPVSRARKKKAKPQKKAVVKKPQPYEVVKHGMYEYRNPFPDDMDFDQRLAVLLKIGENAAQDFEKDYVRLLDYFRDFDPLYLLSFSVMYFLAHQEGIDREAIEGKDEFPPFYIEVLQCLSLFHERTISVRPLVEKADDFHELLKSLNTNQSYRYYEIAKDVKNEVELRGVTLRMEMMSHTLAVRNWAYEPQMQKVAYDLAALVENEFTDKIGISPKQLLDILFNSVELTNDRLNVHLNKLRPLIKAKNYKEVFDRYEASFPNADFTDEEKRLSIWKQSGKNLKNLNYMLFSHADLKLPEIFTFCLEDLKNLSAVECSDEQITKIFDELSYEFGDLKDYDKDHIFLNNPVHQKPFIRLEEKSYFSAINFLLFHLGVDLLEGLIAKDKGLKELYLKAKGKYLENTLEELFRNSFPTATLLAGSIWRDPKSKKEYENDLIVLINDFAFIIEAKSGAISPPARRGATERLYKTLKELVVEPSEQAIRFQNYLKGNLGIHKFSTRNKVINVVDSGAIKYYVPLGITLSNLGPIGCNLKKLTDAGIIGHKLEELAPSISITDLEVIFELLPLEAQKVHYLSRRREFEAHLQFQGDEMDLFAFYLDNGFNIGDDEYDKDFHINLTIKSKEIDPYIIGKSRGVDVPKPGLKMTPFWAALLNKFEKRKAQMWLQASYILLNAPEEDQKMFEQAFEKLKTQILKGNAPKDHNWVMMACGPERRRYVIAGYPYKGITKEKRNEIINEILFKEQTVNIRGIIIVGQDLNNNYYPYSVLAGTMETDFFDSLEIQ
ncbi:hypothetical protein [Mucilaginibacter aquaedulcis]|uniref:hypothetical protein n=1 Tax=Mucilaginibacter aquaedulcis TaxID=1187081 RepID=UPI0025B382AA|nr:hypothetical protein [Mucilaginibacter aquaedulcis]MDN3551011.1 hypothetical protein [Mucilaginibacter aquaedulcis]